MPFRRPVERVQRKRELRNGTESWVLLPLWRRGRGTMPFRRPAERVQRKRELRNGTESRNLLPLWHRDKEAMVQKACREGAAGKDFPQRHRIVGFAAVVAKGQRDNAVQKACRKGQRKRELRNGTESRNLLPLWQADSSPGYLRSFEARRMVSTAPSMPTRSVLTTKSYSPISVHWRPV